MPKGVPNKRYTPEFKKLVVETMMKEKMSYRETARQFEISNHHRVQDWERIYLTEGPEGLAIERRGRSSTGRSKKLPKRWKKICWQKCSGCVRRTITSKKLASLGFGRRATPAQKTQVVQKLRQRHSLDILLSIAQLPRATFYYHLKRINSADKV